MRRVYLIDGSPRSDVANIVEIAEHERHDGETRQTASAASEVLGVSAAVALRRVTRSASPIRIWFKQRCEYVMVTFEYS